MSKSKSTLYILDEPSTGLHFSDVELLINCIKKLKEQGHTVIIIEHNSDIITSSDYIIGRAQSGQKGGKILYQGQLTDIKNSKKASPELFMTYVKIAKNHEVLNKYKKLKKFSDNYIILESEKVLLYAHRLGIDLKIISTKQFFDKNPDIFSQNKYIIEKKSLALLLVMAVTLAHLGL